MEIDPEQILEHPLFEEIQREKNRLLAENASLKSSLKNVDIPYVLKDKLLINTGVHNGIYYGEDILREIIPDCESLQIFMDHADTKRDEAVQTYAGMFLNPRWSKKHNGIIGDLEIIDEKTARALIQGAKFGLSISIDIEKKFKDGKWVASPPAVPISCSLVLNPAVRETMLNEEQEGLMGIETFDADSEELDIDAEILSAWTDFVGKMRKKYPKMSMKEISKIFKKQNQAKGEYPYPAGKKKKKYPYPPEEQSDEDMDELEKLRQEKEELEKELRMFREEKLNEMVNKIVSHELSLKMLDEDSKTERIKELKKMDMEVLKQLSANYSKMLEKLQEEDKEKKEEKKPEEQQKKCEEEKTEEKPIRETMTSEQASKPMTIEELSFDEADEIFFDLMRKRQEAMV
jgi:hypothetical protein